MLQPRYKDKGFQVACRCPGGIKTWSPCDSTWHASKARSVSLWVSLIGACHRRLGCGTSTGSFLPLTIPYETVCKTAPLVHPLALWAHDVFDLVWDMDWNPYTGRRKKQHTFPGQTDGGLKWRLNKRGLNLSTGFQLQAWVVLVRLILVITFIRRRIFVTIGIT